MKRNRYIMERNGKPCYANKICAKKFRYQSYQNSIDKHDYTFMLPKKVTIATIKKKIHKHLSKGVYSTLANFNSHCFMD